MFFLPYKIDSKKSGLPIFTVLICILCTFIYWQQYKVDRAYYAALEKFCITDLDRRTKSLLTKISHSSTGNQCQIIFESIRNAPEATAKMRKLAKESKSINLLANKQDNIDYIYDGLEKAYKKFEFTVPQELTSRLAYDPHSLNVVKMMTSTFSHGDIFHLAGNLLFFYIFAASVELIIGSLVFAGFISVASLGTSLAYSYVMSGVEGAMPTIGLSGVVMGTVAALAVMMPSARIRCFFWFLLFFRIFRIPALFLAVWYIGWDIFEMNQQGNKSYINYVAHVSGAALGGLLGMYYLLFKKRVLEEAASSY